MLVAMRMLFLFQMKHTTYLSFLNLLVGHCAVCPLTFPETSSVTRYCEKGFENKTACCIALGSYVSHLQQQSFITNVQALHCAASLGSKLQRANVTKNVYDLCHITLKDFSLQGRWC